jgi:predicted acyltransferase
MTVASIKDNAERLVSLDAFRGFTIAGMVLVNNPGDWSNLYSQLAHAKWHGWTFTDWIFPFFLFICGVSMVLAISRKSTAPKPALVLDLWRRAAIIFLIGLALNFIPGFSFETLRIPGVLQRIALCTAFSALIVLYFTWQQWCMWIAVLLISYSVVMLNVPVPDVNGVVVTGALDPGRDVGAYLDRLLLSGHLWASAKTWDPEGLFSTLPALASMLLGALVGRWILSAQTSTNKTVWMLISGLACLWMGAILDVVLMPINKPLWTPSYSIFMNGWALLVFGVFYWLIDANDNLAWRERARKVMLPFTIYGMNALFIFALSGLVAKVLANVKFTQADQSFLTLKALLYSPVQALPIGSLNTSLLFAIGFNLVMFAIAWFMWKRRWFVKV